MKFVTGLLAMGCGASLGWGLTIIQPTAETAQDTFVYQFIPAMNWDAPPWNALLAASVTGTGHDLRSYLRFDLSGVSIASDDTVTLNLYVIDTAAAGFGQSPGESAPTTIDLRAVTSSWAAANLNWLNQPGVASQIIDSVSVAGVERWISFDISDLARSWDANPSGNFGVQITQRDPVFNNGRVATTFSASAGDNRPFIAITPIPEPTALLPVLACGWALRRRRTPTVPVKSRP